MADRIEISKLTEFVALGPPPDTIAVSKMLMFVLLTPGSDGPAPSVGQGFVYAQKVPRVTLLAPNDESAALFTSDGDYLIWTGDS